MSNRQALLEGIRDCLEELSDADYQARVWLRGEGEEESSFADVICQLYEYFKLDDLLAKKQIIISHDGDMVLRSLSEVLNSFDCSMPTSEIIDHPRMPEVRRLAKAVLCCLSLNGQGEG